MPLMQIEKNVGQYRFIVKLPMKDKSDMDSASIAPYMLLYTTSGDTVRLPWIRHQVNVYSWVPEQRGLTGMVGIRGYRATLVYAIDDIGAFLGREYNGCDIDDGYYVWDFHDDPKQIRSFNRNLKSAMKILERRCQRIIRTHDTGPYPDL